MSPSPQDLPHRDPESAAASASQLTILLHAAESTIDEEFRRSERLDAKSRNQITLTGTFYAVVQAVSIGLLNGVLRDHGSNHLSPFAPWLACLAIASGLFMVAALVVSYGAWRLRDDPALSIETIKQYVPHAAAGKPAVGVNLISAYADIAAGRRANNEERAEALDRAAAVCGGALAFAVIELALCFVAVAVR